MIFKDDACLKVFKNGFKKLGFGQPKENTATSFPALTIKGPGQGATIN